MSDDSLLHISTCQISPLCVKVKMSVRMHWVCTIIFIIIITVIIVTRQVADNSKPASDFHAIPGT